MAYLLDTNVLIAAKNTYYGFDFCAAFWDWLDVAHQAGTVFSIERVYDELVSCQVVSVCNSVLVTSAQ
jgi:Domain of unknown function (DUF4411)